MKNKFIKIFTSRLFSHIIFWVISLSLILAIFYQKTLPLNSILSAIVTFVSLMVLVYFNLLYLIPKYLSQNRLILYGVTVILSTLAISPMRTLATFYIYTDYPGIQHEIIRSHWAIFFTMLTAVICSTLIQMVFDWFQRERQLRDMESEAMQSELRFLRSQINPHFLFNTLNSLYALTLKKSDIAPDVVIKLSEIMRYMLYECNDVTVPLHKEIAYIENYLELERLRHSAGIQIEFDLNVNANSKEIAPLLFSPFLENAFKHGISKHVEEGFIRVKLNVDDDYLFFNVTNSKPMEEVLGSNNNDDRLGGIGLQNVQRRLDLLYPDVHDLKIEETENTYSISLTLELN